MKLFRFIRLVFLILSIIPSFNVSADQSSSGDIDSVDTTALHRPVTGFYNFEIGREKINDTYLSPLPYTGTSFGVSGFWTKSLPCNPMHLGMYFEAGGNYSSLLNPGQTAKAYSLFLNFKWGVQYSWMLPQGFKLAAGGDIGAGGGVNYIPRNSNNPANAIVQVALSASGSISRYFKIGKLPILVRDQVSIPLMSGFFMPEYGEPYYEISLGNHSGLTHFGWWGNNFSIHNLLSVSLDFGRTAMQLGYRIEWREAAANHLVQRSVRQAFVIGVIPGGLGLKKKTNFVTPLFY